MACAIGAALPALTVPCHCLAAAPPVSDGLWAYYGIHMEVIWTSSGTPAEILYEFYRGHVECPKKHVHKTQLESLYIIPMELSRFLLLLLLV